jgi:catechol 2,3-dioxygenase-like lactoylglutathione lyase family enzyme
MQIKFVSVMVQDQESALEFYTKILGFNKMADIPMGSFRWLTVTSPDGIEGVELVLEPIHFGPSENYQKSLFDAGIPSLALITNNIESDYQRLSKSGVKFRGEPKQMGIIKAVTFEDTCGNLINLVEPPNQDLTL